MRVKGVTPHLADLGGGKNLLFVKVETEGGPHGWGAWEVGLRYSGVQANEPGITFSQFFTPGNIPTFNDHTDQITFGLSWYPNYWIRYSTEFNVDRLKQPSTIGIVPQNYFVVVQRLQFRF